MPRWATEWTKAALLEVQEYVRLCRAAINAMVTRPFYYRDLVQQFDSIGLGSLTVVILTGLFTGILVNIGSTKERVIGAGATDPLATPVAA